MLNKFHTFIFALSAIFILSCNQNSEVKGDNPKENKVTKEEFTNINSDCPSCMWSIKTDPDGTITKVIREAADGSFIRPDGFEWIKVQGESPSKYLREPEGFETTIVEGSNILKTTDGKNIETLVFMGNEDKGDIFNNHIESLESKRVEAFRVLSEYINTDIELETQGTLSNDIVNVFFKGEVKGHQVIIKVFSTTSSESSSSQETLHGNMSVYEDDSGYIDEIKLLIEIDNDKLDLNVRMYEPSTTENKSFTFEQSIKTKISGETYNTTNDFFKKLSDLGLIGERWNLLNPSIPYGYLFYFYESNMKVKKLM